MMLFLEVAVLVLAICACIFWFVFLLPSRKCKKVSKAAVYRRKMQILADTTKEMEAPRTEQSLPEVLS